MYVAHLTQEGYAPKSIDHIHDVLSAVLRTAVKWGHLQENPARGVDLPKLKTVRPKWALTPQQAAALLEKLSPLGRAMVGLAILSGLRRGELFALRWLDIDEGSRVLTVREAVYDMGHANVDTTLNVHTHVLDGAMRTAVDRIGDELFTIVHGPAGSGDATAQIS